MSKIFLALAGSRVFFAKQTLLVCCLRVFVEVRFLLELKGRREWVSWFWVAIWFFVEFLCYEI